MSNIHLKNLLVNEDDTLKSALNKINISGLQACFLVKNNILSNVISDGDIRRSLLSSLKLTDKVKKVKSSRFISVKDSYDFMDLQNKIAKYKIVPILNKKGEVIDYANESRFRQIPQSEPYLNGNELKYITDCIKSGWISSRGKYVNMFEKKFSKFVKNRYCLSTSSGTTALQLAIATLKLKPNEEVIVPDYTFVSPINSIIHSNCKPVLADIDPDTLCVSYDSVKKITNKKTKAIIVVHLYGNSPDLKKIIIFCKKRNIAVIEDCAEAFGTKYNNTHVGNFGDFGTFSFFGNKTISTGEGGMIIFKNKKKYELAKKLRDHGMDQKKKYWHDEVGFNFRLTNMQAAIGCAQLENAKLFIKKKISINKKYKSQLNKLDYLSFSSNKNNVINSHWLSYIKINSQIKNYKKLRNILVTYLNGKGIEIRTGFYSAHLMKIYTKYKNNKINYENSKKISNSIITLPSSVNLKDKEINYICNLILNYKLIK